MIEPVGQKTITTLRGEEGRVACQKRYMSTLASETEEGSCISFLSWVFSPIVNVLNAIFYRISPSIEEYELFEEILEGSFRSGAFILYDQKVGEEEVKKVLVKCEDLYERLCNKWFPNIEGIFFMRVALLKVRLRILAALGQEKKMRQCEELLSDLGIAIPDGVKLQTQLLSLIKKRPYRYILSGFNGVMKILVFFAKKMRGRRDSNSQLPP